MPVAVERVVMEDSRRREVSPRAFLVILTTMLTLVYVDRGPETTPAPLQPPSLGVIASNEVNGEKPSKEDPNGSGLQGEFGLSNFQDGLLSSLYLVGLLIGSPLFSHAARWFNPFRLVGVGIALWTIAVLFCGLAVNFYTLALCRTWVGFGEAAVLAIGPAFIDDRAPREKVTSWLAVLYIALPAGYALGFVFGALVGSALGWRGAFLAEALLMVPFVVFCFAAPRMEINTGEESHPSRGSSQLAIFWKDTKVVFSHAVFNVALIGNACHNAALGVLAYWGAKACEAVFEMKGTDVWVGGIILLTGPTGLMLGGILLDRMGSSMPRALYVGSIADFACFLLIVPSMLFIKDFYIFIWPFSLSFVCLFANLAPVAGVTLWSVPLHLRPLAVSFSTMGLHLFGDVPSPAIEGAMLDFLEGSGGKSEEMAYRLGLSAWGICLLLASAVLFIAARVGRHAKDYRAQTEPLENQEEETELLQNRADDPI